MDIFWGIVLGLAYGVLIGVLKYIFLWRKMIKAPADAQFKDSSFYVRMIISYFVNIAALLLVYFLRNVMPCNFVAAAIAAAVGLSGTNKALNIFKSLGKTEGANFKPENIREVSADD